MSICGQSYGAPKPLASHALPRYQRSMLNEWSDREPEPPPGIAEWLWGVAGVLVMVGLLASVILALIR